MTLEIEGLGFSYGDRRVLDGLDLEMGKGVTAILGPNGAGKSTLVKCVAGVHRPDSGTIRFDGQDLLSGRRDGPSLAYLSQELPRTVGATVLEVMLLGRVRTLSISVTEEDIEKCYGALELLHLEDLAPRDLGELSGGQCQMVMVAQCLVADPELMLLDEPMNNLDLRRELEMFETVCGITRERGLTIVAVLHDINFAARYADSIAVIRDGEVYDHGAPRDVLTQEMIRDVYGVEAEVKVVSSGNVRVDPIRPMARW
ncbi:ATP-binding cassette domain-containing protein [Methanomassiliicoccaceae archaeon DOK]|nr:ATP-binding cassette domain-containing protein [Methanomassiliicoccaceae archaeon DOK]